MDKQKGIKINFFWFRRDLRLEDNKGLFEALKSRNPVIPLFIFDTDILNELESDDPRVNFIYNQIFEINQTLNSLNSSLLIKRGKPIEVWKELVKEYEIDQIFCNHDYEPYAIKRDLKVKDLLSKNGSSFLTFKDQVIFEKDEILKSDNTPYTVFTPYKNKWSERFDRIADIQNFDTKKYFHNFNKIDSPFPKLEQLGFRKSTIKIKPFDLSQIDEYERLRDFPAKNSTSYLGPHLRFGTVSIKRIVEIALQKSQVFLSELIWREFFMQILYHFPHVVSESFKKKYDNIKWLNNETEFEKWCNGLTGYPMVDAGMNQLNQTGFMHNRVRMVTASFLCKHLLIDWRWGEAYFAKKLLDYELSSNNGNWQWAAGCGCDAAPYFRIFNPTTQLKKFDPNLEYTQKWLPEFNTFDYPQPIVEHTFARNRALETYKKSNTMSNNDILKKLRVALHLRNDEIIEILKTGQF